MGYPKGGLGVIHEKLAGFIKKHDGIIHLSTPVKKIFIKDSLAIGVEVDGKKQEFDIIVANLLIQDLFSIVDEQHFPNEYVHRMRTLGGTGSLCAYYSLDSLDQSLMGKTFHFIERNIGVDGNDAVGMIDFMPSKPESGVSPSSHFLVQSYIICTPQEAQDKKTLQMFKKLLDKNLEHLVPRYRSRLRWAIYPAIWHLDGVAKTIDNIKPEITTPVKNLYLIGDCVKAPGIGVNCALNSAQILRNILSHRR